MAVGMRRRASDAAWSLALWALAACATALPEINSAVGSMLKLAPELGGAGACGAGVGGPGEGRAGAAGMVVRRRAALPSTGRPLDGPVTALVGAMGTLCALVLGSQPCLVPTCPQTRAGMQALAHATRAGPQRPRRPPASSALPPTRLS